MDVGEDEYVALQNSSSKNSAESYKRLFSVKDK